tara:strand:- start:825 stop:1349 length:525 start_codon:yes stop_codon:yes gene_type:complete
MLVYGESDAMDSETVTTKIAKELQPIAMSDQIKYLYGDGNAIFHFESELKFSEMTIYCDILIEEFQDFMYVLIPFNGMMSSNTGEDRIKHLLDVNVGTKPINKNIIEVDNVLMDETKIFDMFISIVNADNLINETIQKEEMCNMSLDDILDKMIDQGSDSLTKLERKKLEEYSK